MTNFRVVHDKDRPVMVSQEEKKLSDIMTGSAHAFDPGIARHFGDPNPAIIFFHIHFWLRHYKKTGQNQIDDRTWYNKTHAEIADEIGYFSERQVRFAIEKLIEAGFLISERHDKNKFNRTAWYALANECDEMKLSKSNFEATKKADASDKIVRSDPTKKADVYIQDTKDTKEQQQQEILPAAPVVVFSCLEKFSDEEIPREVKEKITADYAGKQLRVFDAVEVVRNPTFKPEVSLLKSLRAAIKGNWKPTPTNPQLLKENIQQNRDYCLGYPVQIKPDRVFFRCGKCIELNLDPKQFKDLFKKYLNLKENI